MAELERTIILKSSHNLQNIMLMIPCFVCNGHQKYVSSCLNSFHNSVQFSYEIEKEKEISFVEILIIYSGQKIETHL